MSNYVQRVHDDTQRALSELKGQNERLRMQVAALESDRTRLQQEKLRLQGQLITAREELSARNEEHSALVRRLTDVESENQRVASQFVDIETQNTNLANLYVASYQLRSSLKRADVMAAIREIIVNLIGSEDFAIFDEDLELIGWFDEPRAEMKREEVIRTVAATGEPYIATDERSRFSGVTACIPLKVDDKVMGIIAIFKLLPQKANVLQTLDHELLDLLASQAGIALYCTKLHEVRS